MNKAEALKIYKTIQLAQGEHNGRWRDELDHNDSAQDYLKIMMLWADEFEIDYDKDYHNYSYGNDDLEDSQLKDTMGYELKQILDKKLQDIILA